MKKLSIILLMITLLTTTTHANPSFTVGSNYFLTIFAYPHDILKWPGSAVFMTVNPQTMPWQGDVTEISNRPSESYVNNDQEVEFAPPYDYRGDADEVRSWMKVAGYAYQMNSTLGGLYTTNVGKFLVEVDRTSLNMKLLAEGVGRAQESFEGYTEYHMVPFKGETRAEQDNYGFKLIYAHQLFQNPLGLKLKYVQKTSDVPSGYIRFSPDGETINTPHLTWGWATTGCNHIFGYSHINTDAFYQNSYSVFGGYQMDLQISSEYNGNFKTGIRYRRIR